MKSFKIRALRLMSVFGLLFTLSFTAKAQEADSIWYDRKWKETTLPEEYYYLRTIKPALEANNGFEVSDHYPDGKIQMQGYFLSINPEIRHGEFKYYTEAGVLNLKNIWVNNIVAETFHYDSTGKQTHHVIKREYLASLSAEEKSEKYGITDIAKHPEFPGGQEAFSSFLSKSLIYPPKAVQEKVQGIVVVAATINEAGKLKNVRVLKSAHPLLDEEALRVANMLPRKKWTPARDKGKEISADFNFPVHFKL